MMQRNPRAFLRAAATVLRPTTAAVPRVPQTITPQAAPPTRRPNFMAHGRARAVSTTSAYYNRKDDIDIKELPDAYCYVLDVPGLSAGDLTVELVPRRLLKVTGERREDNEAGACSYLRQDRRMVTLGHHFRLPLDADLSSVSAVCRHGVLTVTIAKLLPSVLAVIPRTIEVKS